jgi:AraC-like DNA-binding protein
MSGSSAPVPMFQFSTEAFAKRERLAALRELFGRTICNLDIEPLETADFSASATVCQLSGLGVMFAASGAMDLTHTRELIVDDTISFIAASTSRYTVSHRGRTVGFEPGDGVLLNNAEVARMRLVSSSRFVPLTMPRAAIAPLVPDLDTAMTRRVPAGNAALKLLVGYLESARDAQSLATPELQHLAVTHIYDLLAVALGATHDATEIAYSRGMRAGRLRAAKSFIMHHSGHRELSVGSAAAHLGVTPRYIHMLFETEGSTFTKFMVEQRLAHAYRMLLDPRMTERSISAIAFAAGFNDLSHFNRTFRRHFGKTPSDMRHASG